jgi:hypothetical protein
MKMIIESVAYDTETATNLASGSHDHELSQAWWTLYRTSQGAYFEVVAGHDGVVESFNPLTNRQARRFLEINANHLVEQYFGPMPEARPLRFSRKTVIAATKLLERMTHAEFSEFLLELAHDLTRAVGEEQLSLRKRLNNLIKLLDNLPDRQLDDGELLRDMVVAKATSFVPATTNWLGEQVELPPPAEAFIRALSLDGFVLSEGEIRSALPVDIGLRESQSEIDRLLEKHALTMTKGHLDQALDAHARGDWAAANSQIRTFFESLSDELAVRIDPSATALSSGHHRRERLASLGFFSADLNEWDGRGLGFVNGLMRRLHSQGSHPGLSDTDDSTFRLHIVLVTARLLLARFDAQMT